MRWGRGRSAGGWVWVGGRAPHLLFTPRSRVVGAIPGEGGGGWEAGRGQTHPYGEVENLFICPAENNLSPHRTEGFTRQFLNTPSFHPPRTSRECPVTPLCWRETKPEEG